MAWSNNRGLSLLGTLLAAFLLTATAVATSQLVARTQRASGSSREALTAIMLAREGLELVRALRDTNWFLSLSDNRQWTQGLCDQEEFTLDARAVRNLDGSGDSEKAQLYIADNGEWTHEESEKATAFRRSLSIDCSDQGISLLVTSRVTWPSGGKGERTWIVSERLYDWLP